MAINGAAVLPLWPHQDRAVDTFERYLDDTAAAAAGSALVSMPTGTGKTAVIASLVTTAGDLSRDVIVLTPWKGLSSQLAEDLSARQWANLGVDKPAGLAVHRIPSANKWFDLLQQKPPHRRVWVGTIAKVLTAWNLKGRNATDMQAAFRNVGFAVVDECHYQPSEFWSQAIRAMKLKTCLLTATAFRNDNRYFEIVPSYNYRYGHREAEAERILRRPTFESLGPSSDHAAFATALLAGLAKHGVGPEEKVLIRCGDHEAVRNIVATLNARGETAIGFHDRFDKSGDASLRVSVPAPRDRPPSRFWVHQYKLSEGFDDPNLRVLAFHNAFRNDRSTIQQIGRILRNPSRTPPAPALVFASNVDDVCGTWQRYLDYDLHTPSAAVATFPSLASELLEGQPRHVYWSGQFRRNLDLGSSDLWREFAYSTNVRVWRDEQKVESNARKRLTQESFELLVDSIALEWRHASRLVYDPVAPNDLPNARVIPWIALANSPVLKNASHIETRLGYTALVWHDGFVFLTDSEGAAPRALVEAFSRPGIASLHQALPAGATVTSVSLVNSDLGRDSIRSRSLRARDLDNVASEIGESTYAWSNAQAVVSDAGETSDDGSGGVARYVGTKNSRIHDRHAYSGSFGDYYAWVCARAAELNGTAATAPSLGRYAAEATPPTDAKPLHVLLDLDADWFADDPTAFDSGVVEESGGEVDESGRFVIKVAGATIEASVAWDSSRRRYRILSPELDASAHNVPGGSRRSLVDSINVNQSFRVATRSGAVYSHGYFWDLAKRRTGDDGILGLLTAEQELANAYEEKGTPDSGDGWPVDSVFGIIETKLVPDQFTAGPPFLICTDLYAEIADFIAYDDSTVAFIHAKATKKKQATGAVVGSELSAAAFHEVASQATKNLRYLTLGNTDCPKTEYWSNPWKVKGSRGVRRVRIPAKEPGLANRALWEEINRRIQTHAYHREVWVVAGASLSKAKLKEALADEHPEPHTAQAYVLLTGLWSAAQQCGIRLRVFCSP
ncbi:DEAD/DEAH box helicase [Promicromonospora sp. NPDC019610]|uniref:DEAD/DEAH box helicase n=1 Tax=Promicromonospora sp. NPDC019610 TaxID=3364405 RepID=UPI0037A22FDD